MTTERETTGDDECAACLRLGVACGEHAPLPTEHAADCLRCRDMKALLGVPCAVHHVADCDGEADEGRVSRVEVRAAPRAASGSPTATATPDGPTTGEAPPESAFLMMLRAMRPAQMLSGDLRSVDNGRDSSGGLCETTATERAIDRGDGARARRVSQRVAMVDPRHRPALRWLIDRAHVGDLATLARLYAGQHGPMALRDALDAAATARTKAAATYQREGPSPGCAMTVDGMRAREALTRATGRETAAEAALAAWGVEALGAACAAWQAAGGEERAA
jgi:hypothetical protein